jgi:hypothetical protein
MSQRGSTDYADEVFVDDDGSPEMCWLTAEGRTALEAATIADNIIGLGDGFSVSMVYGVIEPWPEGTSELRFRKVEADEAHKTIPMWEVELV